MNIIALLIGVIGLAGGIWLVLWGGRKAIASA